MEVKKTFFVVEKDLVSFRESSELISSNLVKKGWKVNQKSPNFLFVLGGDGTLLKAIKDYQTVVKQIIFITCKCGTFNFWGNFSLKELRQFSEEGLFKKAKLHLFSVPLLIFSFKGEKKIKKFFSLNEIKIFNFQRPFTYQIDVDGTNIKRNSGTGVVFSTSYGASGFARSVGGATLLLAKTELFQMVEVAPVFNTKQNGFFSCSPVIFSKDQKITVTVTAGEAFFVVDTELLPFYSKKKVEITFQEKGINFLIREKLKKDFSYEKFKMLVQ